MIQPFQPQIYQFKSPDGQLHEVAEELWKWQAEYEDMACLRQFDSKTGLFHSMREIDISRLKSLYILSSSYRETHVVIFPPDGKFELIIKHYRRRENGEWSTFFVFGYHDLETNGKQFLVLHKDKATRTDDFNKIISA